MRKEIAKMFKEMLQNAQLEVVLCGYTSVFYLRRMKGVLVCHQVVTGLLESFLSVLQCFSCFCCCALIMW